VYHPYSSHRRLHGSVLLLLTLQGKPSLLLCEMRESDEEQTKRLPPRRLSRLPFGFMLVSALSLAVCVHQIQVLVLMSSGQVRRAQRDQPYENGSFLDVEAVAKRWNLTSEKAVELLEKQLQWESDYDDRRDFLYFNHPMKSGGTSISQILMKSIGGVFPGSHQSDHFNFAAVNRDEFAKGGTDSLKVAFSHSQLRPSIGLRPSPLARLLNSTLSPERQIKMLTMIREPVAYRASNMYMWMCHFGRLLDIYNHMNQRPRDTCNNVTLSDLVDLRVEEQNKTCPTEKETSEQKRKWCTLLEKGLDPFPYCRSVPSLLQSEEYSMYFHNMSLEIMGQYAHSHVNTKEVTATHVEEYTLEDLGGLGPRFGAAPFAWFGITERMAESTCLFFYTFNVTATTIPKARVMPCRPTNWWSQHDRDVVAEREPLDYAVYRAANAILDVRLLKMKRDIQAQLDAGATLAEMPHVGSGCFI